MRNALAVIVVASVVASKPAISQGFSVRGKRAPDGPVVPGKPLPTNDPIAPTQRPAFAEQSRAPAVVTKTPIAVDVKTRGLKRPWGLAFIGDGRVLVTEKPGAMRVIDMRTGETIGDVRGVPPVVFMGDAGLLDVVTDPAFARNRTIYFTYVESRKGGSAVAVAKARLQSSGEGLRSTYALENLTTLLRVEPGMPIPAHYGSRLLFDASGYLLVTLGERFVPPAREEAQSLASLHGKILRITTDGRPAPGNPFAPDSQHRAEAWSYGHRNPQGLAIHPVTGELWESEHGPQGGDEINRIVRGANYGWPLVAYGTHYDGTPVNPNGDTQMRGTEQPRYYWDPAIAPSGITFYSGDRIPEWRNNLFVAALAGQHLVRLVLQRDRIIGEERLLQDQHQRIRSVKQGPDGALWVITDDDNGRLIRLAPR